MVTLAGIFGQQIYSYSPADFLPLSVSSLPILNVVLHISTGGLLCYFFAILIIALTSYEMIRTLLETRSLKSLKECFSLFVLIGTASFWMKFTFFEKNIGIILFSFGLMIALLVCKMIIASVTRVPHFLCR